MEESPQSWRSSTWSRYIFSPFKCSLVDSLMSSCDTNFCLNIPWLGLEHRPPTPESVVLPTELSSSSTCPVFSVRSWSVVCCVSGGPRWDPHRLQQTVLGLLDVSVSAGRSGLQHRGHLGVGGGACPQPIAAETHYHLEGSSSRWDVE